VGQHGRLQLIDQSWQMARQRRVVLHHLYRRIHGAAFAMAKHDDQRRTKELRCVFQTGQALVLQDIACDAHHEQIARTLIEDKFRADTRVGTAQQRGDRAMRGAARPAARSRALVVFAA
jgi:hypothetical protein